MNKACIIGNLTRDPELRTTQSGLSVCNFTLAVNRRAKKDGQQETDFIDVVAWRVLADNCAKYLAKGKKAAVIGAIQTSSYEDRDGNKRKKWEILADEVEFLTPVGQGAAGGGYSTAVSKGAENPQAGFTTVENEDLPF